MRIVRTLRAVLVAAAVLSLAACTGFETSGTVHPGLAVDDAPDNADVDFLPGGPIEDASPEEIVRGFVEAGISPVDNWAIARQFLAEPLSQNWKPDAGVTIDTSLTDRVLTASPSAEGASERTVALSVVPTGSVDEAGIYRAADPGAGAAELSFQLARDAEGQWRITAAPPGIVLDEELFFEDGAIFRPYTLHYFDPGWDYLVPDVRWFPVRRNTATRIVRALVDEQPSPWLAGAVRTAFPADVALAPHAVPVEGQVASVDLGDAAATLEPIVLSRMRVQLEQSLADAGVAEVRLTSGGRELEVETATLAPTAVDPRALVLSEEGFGFVQDDELVVVDGVSDALAEFSQDIASIEVGGDPAHALVRTEAGEVYLVGEGRVDKLDDRDDLIVPSLDAYGYAWTVPGSDPGGVVAWAPSVTPFPVGGAFPDASAISALRVSRDGTRVAAVVAVGNSRWLVVAHVLRGDKGQPLSLGAPERLAPIPGTTRGLTWIDEKTIGVLSAEGGDVVVREQMVGGEGRVIDAPDDAVAIVGANSASSVRLLSTQGVVSVRLGSTWQATLTGVRVLASQSAGTPE